MHKEKFKCLLLFKNRNTQIDFQLQELDFYINMCVCVFFLKKWVACFPLFSRKKSFEDVEVEFCFYLVHFHENKYL